MATHPQTAQPHSEPARNPASDGSNADSRHVSQINADKRNADLLAHQRDDVVDEDGFTVSTDVNPDGIVGNVANNTPYGFFGTGGRATYQGHPVSVRPAISSDVGYDYQNKGQQVVITKTERRSKLVSIRDVVMNAN